MTRRQRQLTIAVLYGAMSALASLGIYAAFGLPAQLIALPFMFLGGIVVGTLTA